LVRSNSIEQTIVGEHKTMNGRFGKKKLVRDISANTVQTGITQLFGLIIFYITSRYLTKDDFGEFNWSMAVGFTAIACASLGLDLVFVKKIASGENVLEVSGIHFFHTVIVGVVLILIALVLELFVPPFSNNHPLFFFVLLNIVLINIANSFKLCLNGLDSYKQLAILAICVNVFKLASVMYLYVTENFLIMNVIIGFLITSVLEVLLGYYLMNRSIKARVKPLLKIVEYKYFILESLPQLGVVVFDSALSRMDLILLGILSTASITGEYSFVYKVYELSKLPLIIVAPVLLTRFSKIFSNNKIISDEHRSNIRLFFKIELFVMMFIPMILICCWTPLVDYFTNDKYGRVNEVNYWILSLCVPLVSIINFLWTMGFVQGQLKTILFITVVVSVLNILANFLLIPFYGSLGSAISFLICTVIQLLLYIKYIDQSQVKVRFKSGAAIMVYAGVAILLSKLLANNIIFTTIIALGVYVGLTVITKQISVKQIKQIIYNQ
jgi:O-antigen/teichoic acid export membrane protein